MDPDGHYECSGSKDQCAGLKAALTIVKTADANLKAGTTGKAMLDKVLSFYREGKKNGVEVNFNNTDKGAYGSTSTKDGVTTISLNAKTLEQTGNTGRGEAVAHEGTHGQPGITPAQRTLTITRDAYSNAQYDCKDGGCQ
jgi:hypothetical protein